MQQYSHLKFSYMQQTIIYQSNSCPALGTSRLNRNGLYLSICISPYFGASIKIGPGKMGKDILNKTGKRGILDIVTGCPG